MLLIIEVILIITWLLGPASSVPEKHPEPICLQWQGAPTTKRSGRLARSTGS